MSNYKDNLSNMMCLDLYLDRIPKKEYEEIRSSLHPISHSSPLLGLDLYAENFQLEMEMGRRRRDLQDIFGINPLFSEQMDPAIILNSRYDALIITNHLQEIQWVNKGFSKMTGYTAGYARGKTPKFLQGEETLEENRKRIRERLFKKEIFTEIVVNYRKTREKYKCEITIIPLIDETNNISHFLAIEKEVA